MKIANADFPSFDVAHIAIAKRVRDQGYKVVKGNFLRTDRYTGRTFWCCGKDVTGKRCAYTVTFRLHEDSEGYRLSDHDSLYKNHTCVTGIFPREECDKYIVQMIQKYNLYPIATHGGSFASIVQSEEEARLRVPVPPLANLSGIIRSYTSVTELAASSVSSSPRPLSPSSPTALQIESNSIENVEYVETGIPSRGNNYLSFDNTNQAAPPPHATPSQRLGNNPGHLSGPATCSVAPPLSAKPAVVPDLAAAGLLLDFFFHSTQSGGGGASSSSSSLPSVSNDSERHGNGESESNQPSTAAESGVAESKDL